MLTRLVATLCAGLLAHVAPAQEVTVANDGLKGPTDLAAIPGTGMLYVIEQKTGAVRLIENGTLAPDPVMVIPNGRNAGDLVSRGWEQGLLGICLDLEHEHMYLNYTTPRGSGKGTKTRVSRFDMRDPRSIDRASESVVIEISQPWENHNGGCIRFGPDGMLYIGMGDGGAGGDPRNVSQNPQSLLGKMLRLDVRPTGDSDAEAGYRIPPDNPFAEVDNARSEIWATGVRNPWGMAFDSDGRLWFGDVGQNRFEEIDMIPPGRAGLNFGWKKTEGHHRFSGRGGKKLSGDEHADLGFEPPIWAYKQKRGGSVTGGIFYEGSDVPTMTDRYLFADFMFGEVWSFRLKNGAADDVAEHTDAFARVFPNGDLNFAISNFGLGPAGQLYVLDHKGGRVLEVVAGGTE